MNKQRFTEKYRINVDVMGFLVTVRMNLVDYNETLHDENEKDTHWCPLKDEEGTAFFFLKVQLHQC